MYILIEIGSDQTPTIEFLCGEDGVIYKVHVNKQRGIIVEVEHNCQLIRWISNSMFEGFDIKNPADVGVKDACAKLKKVVVSILTNWEGVMTQMLKEVDVTKGSSLIDYISHELSWFSTIFSKYNVSTLHQPEFQTISDTEEMKGVNFVAEQGFDIEEFSIH